MDRIDGQTKEASKVRGGTAMACLGSWHSQRIDPAVVAHDAVPTPVAGVARRGPARRGVRPLALERVESRTCENKPFQFRLQKKQQQGEVGKRLSADTNFGSKSSCLVSSFLAGIILIPS